MKEKNKTPFKFLDSYTIEDKDMFFGRDEESKELYKKFFSSNLLVLYGKSGVGKSSLINCGLMANIPTEDAMLIPIRCGGNPYVNLIEALKKLSDNKIGDELSYINNIFEQNFKPMAFVFDQFEEIFIIANESKRVKFINALKKILSIKFVKINIILSIREEYLANLTELEKLIPNLFNNRMRLQNVQKKNYKELVEKPCKKLGIKIEPGVVDNILNNIKKHLGELELTYFQVYMDRLYYKARERNESILEFKLVDLKQIGAIENVLGDFLNNELAQIKYPKLAEIVLKGLITSKGTKKQISTKDLAKASLISEEKVKIILQDFVNRRIVRERNERGEYELLHDSLAKRISERISQDDKKADEIKKLIINRYNDYLKNKTYIDKETLSLINPFINQIPLPKQVFLFVKKSKERVEEKSNYRILLIMLGIIIPFVVIMYIMLVSLNNKDAKIQKLVSIKEKYESQEMKRIISKLEEDFVKVEGGEFFVKTTGVNHQDTNVKVKVGTFLISQFEVTVEEYRVYCNATGKKMPLEPSWGWSDKYPIVNVNWNDANNYCTWLSRQTNNTYRLPTEMEFLYASMGGKQTKGYKYSGDNYAENVAVYGKTRPAVVGSRSPNELSIYDMSGNVREWCYDWYSDNILLNTYDNPIGPTRADDEDKLKTVRGGAFSSGKENITIDSRYYGRIDAVPDKQGEGLHHFGFRCVRESK